MSDSAAIDDDAGDSAEIPPPVTALRALQLDLLQQHEITVNALAAVQSAKLEDMTQEEIQEIGRMATLTARSCIGALMAASHLCDIVIDFFERVESGGRETGETA